MTDRQLFVQQRIETLRAAAKAINELPILLDRSALRATLALFGVKISCPASGWTVAGLGVTVSNLSVRRNKMWDEHLAALAWARAALAEADQLQRGLDPASIQHPPYSHPGDVA